MVVVFTIIGVIIDNFIDLESDSWYHDGIEFCLKNKLLDGINEGYFGPDIPATRNMMMTVLDRLDGYDTTTGTTWDEIGKAWARINGVAKGIENTGNITREEFACMLYRYAQLSGDGFTGDWMFMLDYKDASDISNFASEAMHWCVMKGIINGKKDNILDPKGLLTRAEAATMIRSFVER